MTEKEKARELLDKMENEVLDTIECRELYSVSAYKAAKQCALIAVDEILKSDPISPHSEGYYETLGDRFNEVKTYWLNVGSEIEKL